MNGIVVPFSSNSSYSLDASQSYLCGKPQYDVNEAAGSHIEDLYPDEGRWASLLSCFGFSTRVVADCCDFEGQIVAISGQWFRNWTSDEVARLFESNLILLEGSAAATLNDIGLGHLAGIRAARRLKENTGVVSYEQISDGMHIRGIDGARCSAQRYCGDVLLAEYGEKAHVVTELKDFKGNTTAPGTVVYDDRCIILPFFFPDSPEVYLLTSVRQELFQVLLSLLARDSSQVSFSVNSPYLAVYRYDQPDGTILLLANASSDGIQAPMIYLGGFDNSELECELCGFDGVVSTERLQFDSSRCVIPVTIPPMQMILVGLKGDSR